MRIHQWEVWKTRPPGFEADHWFVIISGQERCDAGSGSSRLRATSRPCCDFSTPAHNRPRSSKENHWKQPQGSPIARAGLERTNEPCYGLTPAMGWFVKGKSAVNLFFSFLFCAIESYVAFWIVSSGRARARRPGLTCYPYILCGVHYIVSNPARGAHGDQSLNRAIQRPRGQHGLRYAPKVSCDLSAELVGRVLR
jgi:hypothetical protein